MRYEVWNIVNGKEECVLSANNKVEAVKKCKALQDDIARRKAWDTEKAEIREA